MVGKILMQVGCSSGQHPMVPCLRLDSCIHVFSMYDEMSSELIKPPKFAIDVAIVIPNAWIYLFTHAFSSVLHQK